MRAARGTGAHVREVRLFEWVAQVPLLRAATDAPKARWRDVVRRQHDLPSRARTGTDAAMARTSPVDYPKNALLWSSNHLNSTPAHTPCTAMDIQGQELHETLAARAPSVFLDVREPWEHEEELATHHDGRAVMGMLNVDESPDTPMQFNVRGLPTFLIFRKGDLHGRMPGATTKQALMETLEALR